MEYEINQSISERGAKESLWEKLRDARDGIPEVTSGNAFLGASKIVTPITEILVNNIFGKLKDTFHRSGPFFVYKSIAPNDEVRVEACDIITKYVEILTKSKLDINWNSIKTVAMYETDSIGTCYLYTNWVTDRKKFKQKVEGQYQDIYQEFSGIRVDMLPVDSVFFRSNSKSVQDSAFFAIESTYQEYQLRNLVNMGYLDEERVEKVIQVMKPDDSIAATASAERNEEELSDDPIAKVYQCYYRYDADGDGYAEDLIVTYCLDSNTILDIKYNEFGERTIVPVRYMFKTGKIEGRGVAETVQNMQAEADFHHRVRIDTDKYNACPVFVTRIGSGIRANESFYPGKLFVTAHGKEDLVKLEGGAQSQLSLNAEEKAVQYAQESTAMSSIAGGFADPVMKSRDSVRGSAMRLEQSTGITTAIFENMEDAFNQVGLHILYYLVRNREAIMQSEQEYKRLTDEELGKLEVALTQTFGSIPLRFYCDVHVADQTETLEGMKQNYIILYQMLGEFYEKIFPVYNMVFGQQGAGIDNESKAVLLKAISGSSELMEKIFNLYGEDAAYKYLPNTQKAEILLEMKKQMDQQAMGMGEFGQGVKEQIPQTEQAQQEPEGPTQEQFIPGGGGDQGANY